MSDDIRPDVLDRARAEYVELTARMNQDVARLVDDLELNRAERLRLMIELVGASGAGQAGRCGRSAAPQDRRHDLQG